jgi:opacity protein-like surface antigen
MELEQSRVGWTPAGLRCFGLLFGLVMWCPLASIAQQADGDAYRWQVFAQGGASVSSSVSRTFSVTLPPPDSPLQVSEQAWLSTTGRGFVGARYGFTDRDELEVSYSFHPGSVRSISVFPSPAASASGSDSLPVNAHYLSFNYVRRFAAGSRVQPFATGGVGLALFDMGIETEKKFTGNLGLGLDVELSPRWSFRVENRTFIMGAPRGVNAARGGTLFQWVPSAGLVLRF